MGSVLTYRIEIAKRKDIHVVPQDGQWATKRAGASRAGIVLPTQKAVIDRARVQAKREKVDVVIHGRNGKIRNSDSYGKDPFPPKDKKH